MSRKYQPAFKPDIFRSNNGGYWLTAPREIRNTVWDLLSQLQDGVIHREGGEATEIFVSINDGYHQVTDAFFVLLVATYIATYDTVSEILAVPNYDEHFKEIKSRINFKESSTPAVTQKDIAPWIDAYLCAATTKMLNDSILGQFNTLDGGLKSYISQTNLMKNRITVEVNGFWNLATRIKWLRQCEDALTYFNERLMTLKEIARFIDQKYKEAQEVIQLYYNHMTKTGPVGQIAVYREAEKSLSQIMASVQKARQEINKEEIKEVFETVSTLLPPVSKQ